jgi:hypothetical protein
VDQGYVNCAPYTCNGTACNTSCNSNLDCAPGNTCLGAPGGVCKVNNGEPCNADSQCLNNFCTDGVCCDARCGGLCEKCNLVNQLGLCKPVPNGADPDIECEEDPVSTCQHDGYCDGAKKCALYAPYTQCKSAGCYGDEYRNADVCDGNGNCVDNGGWSCVPYTCVNGACKTSCASSLDCASGYSCMSGVCLRNNGQPCSAGSQCYSNYCADGVCCDGDCLGLCRKCNFAGHVGTCTYAPVDTDPEENCAQDPVSTCGRNGDCDGNGGCKKYPVNTECIPIHCSEDFNHVHLASKCDGSGACVDGGSVSCEPYACGSGACKTSCALNSDCFTGYSCYAGACKKNLGVSCSGNSDCASNHCADGVCCEAACDGTCEKCNLPAREGHCDPIQDGTDLDNECTQGDVSNCGQDGWCNGARQCRKYIMGTVCVQPACSGPYTLLNISMCDGQGTCVSGGSTSCSPYVCSTAGGSPACKTSCSGDYECAPGYGCSGGLCKLNNGGLCNTAGECKSGWCTDHVCCDGPCGNLCERCDLQGHVGQCTYAPSGSDPDNECDDDGVTSCQHNGKCDGIGNCQLYPAGAVCSPAHCDGSSLHLAGTCAGTGAACADNGTEDCLPYNCFGGACLTSCSYDYDCSTGFRCNTGTHTCMKGIGQSCTTGSECYDGYCCNNKCTDLNEPNNCGSCGNVCQQVHGTNNCYYGTCGPQCDTGYGNCDGNGNNGCETDFSSSPNSCGNAVDLGSTCSDDECYDGFLGCDNATWTVHSNKSGITSKWFKVRFLECESDFWCCADLTGKLFLNVPPGVDYNLYAYSSCGTLWHQSTKGTGQSEAITITHHGGCDGNDDSFDVYIEVRYISGENCGGWTLTVQGQSC